MNDKDYIDMASAIINAYRELKKIAKTIHKLDENDCNGFADTDWGRKAEARNNTKRINLLRRGRELANNISLAVYHQADPRGCSLYLIPQSMKRPAETYTNGIAIY